MKYALLILLMLNVGFAQSDYFKTAKRLAAQGNVDAQYNLGMIYAKGEEVPKNYHEAFKWLKLAAQQGDAESQYRIGIMYLGGFGVRQNHIESKKWFGKSCDNGYQNGCNEYRKLNQKGY